MKTHLQGSKQTVSSGKKTTLKNYIFFGHSGREKFFVYIHVSINDCIYMSGFSPE